MLSLAWKNLWRKKGRSFLVVSATALALVFSLLMSSLSAGGNRQILETAVRATTGYIQVMTREYDREQSINELIPTVEQLPGSMRSVPGVRRAFPRLETVALAISDQANRGVSVVGTPPADEAALGGIDTFITRGRWLTADDAGIVISEGLAAALRADLGSAVLLYGGGYHGETAAGAFPVVGVLRLTNPEMNQQAVYLALPAAQAWASAPDLATSWIIDLDDPDDLQGAAQRIERAVGDGYVARTWKDLQPELEQMIAMMATQTSGMIYPLYLIVLFGVFGTLLSMTLERRREWRILRTLGMSAWRVNVLQIAEAAMLGALGLLAGLAVGGAAVTALSANPIPLSGGMAEGFIAMGAEPVMAFGVDGGMFLVEARVVAMIFAASLVFPAIVARRT